MHIISLTPQHHFIPNALNKHKIRTLSIGVVSIHVALLWLHGLLTVLSAETAPLRQIRPLFCPWNS